MKEKPYIRKGMGAPPEDGELATSHLPWANPIILRRKKIAV